MNQGFWGPVTSSHDWCESNYVVTSYIAEFWNTLSSLPIAALGLFGMVYTFSSQKTYKLSFLLAYIGLVIVGLGSALFHATLRFEAQMADEYPMILGSLIYSYIVLDVQFMTYNKKMPNWLNLSVVLGLTCFAGMMAYVMLSDSSTHLPFILTYCGIVGYITVGSMDIVWNLNDKFARKWWWISLYTYMGGGAIWLMERNLCGASPVLEYFHVIWHLAAGFGTFSILMCMFYVQVSSNSVLKKSIVTNSLGIPYVRFHQV